MRKKDQENKISWLQVIIIFLLGVCLVINIFLFMDIQENKVKLADLEEKMQIEIDKLKADDLALAQAFNNLTTQLQALGIIKISGDNNNQ